MDMENEKPHESLKELPVDNYQWNHIAIPVAKQVGIRMSVKYLTVCNPVKGMQNDFIL